MNSNVKIIFVVYYVWSLRRRILLGFIENSYVSNLIDDYQKRSILITMIALIISNIKCSGNYIDILRELNGIDEELRQCDVNVNYRRTKNFALCN